MTTTETETELLGFELRQHTDVDYLNGAIKAKIKCGWTIQGESYHYVDQESGKVKHVVPMAKWGTVR